LKINLISTIALFLIGASTYAATRNIDTPNLSFEKGTFENWTRYYGYYGPVKYETQDESNSKLIICNVISEDVSNDGMDPNAHDTWTIKEENINAERGYFEVVASTGFDFNLACDNIRLVPEGFGQSMRIGSYDEAEVHYNDSTILKRKNRAMAEKATYQFEVKENSTLLSLRYAVIMQNEDPISHTHPHTYPDNERPRFSIKVRKADGTLIPSQECGAKVEYRPGDSRLKPASRHQRVRTVTTRYEDTDECEEWECDQWNNNCLRWGDGTNCLYYTTQTEKESRQKNNCSTKKEFNCKRNRYGYDEYRWRCDNCNNGWNYNYITTTVCGQYEQVCKEYECTHQFCKKYKQKEINEVTFGEEDPNTPCSASHVKSLLSQFSYDGWVTLSYDLREFLGQTVTIEVENRDCLEQLPRCGGNHPNGPYFYTNTTELQPKKDNNGQVIPGTYMAKCSVCSPNTERSFVTSFTGGYHRTYAYINASTQKMELKIKNCGGGEDAVITAPDAFDTYEWKRLSDGKIFKTKSSSPYICAIPNSEIRENEDYTCTMYDSTNENCTKVVETFRLLKNPITAEFEWDKGCYNEVQFQNLSRVDSVTMSDGTKMANDEIAYQVWTFYDQSGAKEEENGAFEPTKLFNCKSDNGCTFSTKLAVITKNDCRVEVIHPINVERRPDVIIDGDEYVCYGDSTELRLNNNSYPESELAGNGTRTYRWLNEVGDILKEVTVTGAAQDNTSGRSCIVKPSNGTVRYRLQILQDRESDGHNIMHCVFEGTHDVSVIEKPTSKISISNMYTPEGEIKQVDICNGETIKLTGTTSMDDCQYGWFDKAHWTGLENVDLNGLRPMTASTTDTNDINVLDTTQYYLVFMAENGCTQVDSIQTNAIPLPKLTITANNDSISNGHTEICVGESTTMRVSGKDAVGNAIRTFVWTTPNQGQPTLDAITATPAEDANNFDGTKYTYHYEVKGSDQKGCTGESAVDIWMYKNPTITFDNSPSNECAGVEFELKVNGVDSCVVDNSIEAGSLLTPPDTIRIPLVANEAKRFYMVEGFKKNGGITCKTTNEFSIDVNQAPKISIIGERVICEGEPISWSAIGADVFTWWLKGDENNKKTGTTFTDTPRSDTLYYVEGSNISGAKCKSTEPISVSIEEAPEIEILFDNTKVCEGGTKELTAQIKGTGNGQSLEYSWSNGAIGEKITVAIYQREEPISVTGKTGHNCISTASITLESKPYPTLTAATGVEACENSSVEIALKGADKYIYQGDTIAKNQSPNAPYAWVINDVGRAGTKEFIYTGSLDGCEKEDFVTINVLEAPALAISGAEGGICKGESATLSVTGGENGNEYIWEYSTNNGTTWDTLSGKGRSVTVKPTIKTQYRVSGMGGNGCKGTSAVAEMEVYTIEPIHISRKTAGTDSCVNSMVYLSATGAGNNGTYAWNITSTATGQTIANATGDSIQIPLSENANVRVVGTTEDYCNRDTFTTITVYPYPDFTMEKDYVCQGDQITMVIKNVEGKEMPDSIQWVPISTYSNMNETGYVKGQTSFTDQSPKPGNSIYQIKVNGKSEKGCITKKSFNFSVVSSPNIYITGKNEYCEDDLVHLTAKGGSTYKWDNGTTGETYDSIAKIGRTTIHVTGEDSRGCSSSAEYNLTIRNIPDVSINASQITVCSGEPVTLQASGAGSYTWEQIKGSTPNDTTNYPCSSCQSINPIVEEATTFIVTGVENGCYGTAVQSINVKTKPVLRIYADKDTLCKGNSTNITVYDEKNSVSVWKLDGVDVGETSSSQHQFSTGNLTERKKYEITAQTAGNDGCVAQENITIEIYSEPTIGIDKGLGYVCKGSPMELSAIGDASLSYEWIAKDNQGNNANITYNAPTSNTSNKINVTFDKETQFTLIAKYANDNCTTTSDPVTVEVKNLPTITVFQDPSPAVCQDKNVKLTAQGNGSVMNSAGWTWKDVDGNDLGNKSNVYNIQKINGSGEYFIKGTDRFGCESEWTPYNVFITNAPEFTIHVDKENVCKNETVHFSVTSTDAITPSYSWDNGNGSGTTFDTTLTIAKVYTIKVTASNGSCTTTKTKDVTVNDIPRVTITSRSGKNSICKGDSIILQANYSNVSDPSNLKYSWNNKNWSSKEDSSQYYAKYISSASSDETSIRATVQVQEGECKSSPATFNVTINSLPNVKINGATEKCIDEVITLTANGVSTNNYSWYQDGTSVGGGTEYRPAIRKESTKFVLIGTEANGCVGTDTVDVKGNPNPSFDMSAQPVCVGENGVITFSDIHNVAAFNIKRENVDDTIRYNAQQTGISYTTREKMQQSQLYSVVAASDKNCKSEVKNQTITVNALPNIQIACDPISREICLGDSAILTATGGTSYTWRTASGLVASNNTSVFKPTASGTYTLRVKGEGNNGCSDSTDITITVYDIPVIKTEPNVTLCQGDVATLKAEPANGSAQNLTYVWNNDNGILNGATIYPVINKNETFTVYGSDDHCSSQPVTVNVFIKQRGDINIATSPICEGTQAKVTFSASDLGSVSLQGGTTYDQTVSQNGVRKLEITFDGLADTKTYTAIVVDTNQCSIDTSFTIEVVKKPVISFDPNTDNNTSKICLGDSVTITAKSDQTSATLAWVSLDNLTQPVFTIDNANSGKFKFNPNDPKGIADPYKFTVTATNAHGTLTCTSNETYNVVVYDEAVNSIKGDQAACEGSNLTLSSEKTFSSYTWTEEANPNNILSSAQSLTEMIETDKTYILTVYDVNGCKNESKIDIKAVPIPKFEIKTTPICQGDEATSTVKKNQFG